MAALLPAINTFKKKAGKAFYNPQKNSLSSTLKILTIKGDEKMSGEFGMSEWIGPLISAVGNVGGGIAAGASTQSSDGFSKKGAGQQLQFEYGAAPTRAATLLRYAKTAGIHPLAVLGNQGMPSSPVIVGDSKPGTDYGIGNALDKMGQDVSRAQHAKLTPHDRAMQFLQRERDTLINDNLRKDGQLKDKKLLDEDRDQPTMPARIDDYGNILPKNTEFTRKPMIPEGQPGTEPGHSSASQWFNLEGSYFKGMSDRFADASEEDIMAKARYWKKMLWSEIAPYPPPSHVKTPGSTQWKWVKGSGWTPTVMRRFKSPKKRYRKRQSRKKATKYLNMGEIGY